MIDLLDDAVKNALDVVTAPLNGELPTKQQVAKLIADGITLYAVSEITGIATETLEKLLEDE